MKKVLAGLVVGVLVIAGAGFVYLDRTSNGIVGFYVWKALSGVETASAHAELGNISLYYETFNRRDEGAVPVPVLVLHGGTAFLETMHYQIEALASSRFVIAPDSRAQGRTSDAEGVALSYSLMADDMVALLDQLGVAKVDIVGWSDGGNIGLDMAIRYTARVNRLVMYGSNFHFSGTGGDLSGEPDPEAEQWAAVRSFYQDVAVDPAQWPIMLSKVFTMWRDHPTYTVADLGKIRVPVLVMAGEFDSIEDAHTREMAGAIPGAELLIVEGADHYAPLMAPDKVNPAMLAFLD
ncbi:MAG: alpha/beta hydrolase [Parvibaculum sp.]